METEIKIFCQANPLLNQPMIDVTLVKPRHFEDNWLFDFDDQRLRSSNCALRLRIVGSHGWLTFKAGSHQHAWLKVREEIQVDFDQPEAMWAILEAIGLKKVFRYQKFRTYYLVKLPSGQNVEAMFDETPMGNFLEVEGEEQSIAELVELLRIPSQFLIKASYPALWNERQKSNEQSAEDMIFPSEPLEED